MDKTQPHPLFKLATELGPLIVFFVVNGKFNLFAATGAFMRRRDDHRGPWQDARAIEASRNRCHCARQ